MNIFQFMQGGENMREKVEKGRDRFTTKHFDQKGFTNKNVINHRIGVTYQTNGT